MGKLFIVQPSLDLNQVLGIYNEIINQNRFDLNVIFLHYIFILQSSLYLLDSLHVGVDDLRSFGGVTVGHELAPSNIIEHQVEV